MVEIVSILENRRLGLVSLDFKHLKYHDLPI